jgi:hypothetical protein
VTITQGSATLLVDTVTTGGTGGGGAGSYTARTARVPYKTDEITATVSVTADGYNPGAGTATVAASTTTITLNVELADEGTPVISVMNARVVPNQSTFSVFTINGKLLGTGAAGNQQQLIGSFGRQPLILQTVKNGQMVRKSVVLPR